MITADELRRAASSLPEAEEHETWDPPAFRVGDMDCPLAPPGSGSTGAPRRSRLTRGFLARRNSEGVVPQHRLSLSSQAPASRHPITFQQSA